MSDSGRTISVIVVNHNGRRFLDTLFTSIRNQTERDWEALLVDSASTDDSLSYARERYQEVRTLAVENRGYGNACNAGARAATGEYVMFLNEDMRLPPTLLADLRTRYEQIRAHDPDVGALACTEDQYSGERNPDVFPGTIDLFGFVGPNRRRSLRGCFIPGCPFFTARELFLQSGGFSEHIFMYGDDLDLSWRFTLLGKHNYSAPDIRLYHEEGGSLKGFPPRKVYYLVHSTLVTIFNNASLPLLTVLLTANLLFTLTATNVGLVVFSGNPRYGAAILRAVWDFYRKIPRLVPFRRRVQRARVISDRTFLRENFTAVPHLSPARIARRL